MPSPFYDRPMIREWSWKKTQIKKRDFSYLKPNQWDFPYFDANISTTPAWYKKTYFDVKEVNNNLNNWIIMHSIFQLFIYMAILIYRNSPNGSFF